MLTLRKRIFIVASIFVLMVLVIVLTILSFSKDEESANEANQPSGGTEFVSPSGGQPAGVVEQPVVPPTQIEVKQTTSEEMQKNAAIQVAKIFLERYGSYSTDNAYQNILDSEVLVTDGLWSELEAKIKGNTNFTSFVGVSVQSVASSLLNWKENEATVSVSVIKSEKRDSETKNYQLEYEVEVVKQDEKWLVDKFFEVEI